MSINVDVPLHDLGIYVPRGDYRNVSMLVFGESTHDGILKIICDHINNHDTRIKTAVNHQKFSLKRMPTDNVFAYKMTKKKE